MAFFYATVNLVYTVNLHTFRYIHICIYSETCLQPPPNGILLCLLGLIWVAKGHLDELQKAEIVSTSKLVPSVLLKHITE